MMTSGNGWTFTLALAFACGIPLVYLFHNKVLSPNYVGETKVVTQSLKEPKGPPRWNPFQSKEVTEKYEMMKGFDHPELPPITLIDIDEFKEILEDLHKRGRKESKYVVLDVRSEEEIERTGVISEDVYNIPIHCVTMRRAFAMGEEEFYDSFGFEKPKMDETVVFSCKTGKSSQMAAEMAAMEGYQNLLNYMGGSNEFFG